MSSRSTTMSEPVDGAREAVSDSRRAERALLANEAQFRALSENLADGMVYQINSGRDGSRRDFTYVSRAVERLHGLTVEQLLENADLLYRQIYEEDRRRVAELEAQALASCSKLEVDVRVLLPSGEVRWRRFTSCPRPCPDGSIVWDGLEIDITDRKRAELEHEKLQAQLLQAQKMESVGRLAGGVAHDFNNMLQAILGNLDLVLEQLPAGSPLVASLEEIRKSALHSADLTRQLLAFARRQPIQPRAMDLNGAVAGTLKMIRRLIGEDIDLVWRPSRSPWPVKMDPGQIDQILANLCINARDAIAGAGRVVIETRNVTMDDALAAAFPEASRGDYVRLSICDTGHGMDAETRAHLFEPFFTTKEVGKGTGLGLATVFGIVKQNGGFIEVISAPGEGTTFGIYLPRADGPAGVVETGHPGAPRGGTETVLFVEDEESILNLGRLILQKQGYRVLTASTPHQAEQLVANHKEPIDLLISDVVMPGMNGNALRERIVALRPRMKCILISGYPAEQVAPDGIIGTDVHFLQKPFSNRALVEKVREVLGVPHS